jgi:hypothetical protein
VEYKPEYIQDLLNREWFTRMWTFQEIVIAKRPFIMCGKKVISWSDLAEGIDKAATDDFFKGKYQMFGPVHVIVMIRMWLVEQS